jgi:hypothetical protein
MTKFEDKLAGRAQRVLKRSMPPRTPAKLAQPGR